jgi:hypothetical protein
MASIDTTKEARLPWAPFVSYANHWEYDFVNVENIWDEINGWGDTLREQRLSLQMLLTRRDDIAIEIRDKLKEEDKTSDREAFSKCNDIVRNYMKTWPPQGSSEEWVLIWQRFCQKVKAQGRKVSQDAIIIHK